VTVVIGTAGHIDHGKTRLLRALTGIDADRLPEERRRGLTIDVGYAHGAPDDGPELDFVDVPGHDRLVGNMLVGVGEVDAGLLVVAADDGPRAQTWEHLGLLDAMGIDMGVAAITKVDLVDEARARLVGDAVRTDLARTRLAGASVVPVSATTGRGLDELRHELAALRDSVMARRPPRPVDTWLAIDRAFSVHGHGVVVTGSSRGGPIRAGDMLRLRPGSRHVRVRAVHVHDEIVDGPVGTGRVALNLAGLELGEVRRGMLLTASEPRQDPLTAFDSDRLLVALRPPAALPGRALDDAWPPRDGAELRLHIGTEQVGARLGRGGRLAEIAADGPTVVLLRLERAIATAIGERFVLRRPPPAGLLAGGVVLDADMPRGRARTRLSHHRLEVIHDAVVSAQPEAVKAALVDLHGAHGVALAPDVQLAARSALVAAVRVHQEDHPDQIGLPLSSARASVVAIMRRNISTDPKTLAGLAETIISSTLAEDELEQAGDAIRTAGFQPDPPDAASAQAAAALVAALDVDAPPPLAAAMTDAGCSQATRRQLERDGHIIVVGDDVAWSAGAFGRLRDLALDLADVAPLTPAALRDASGTSRKYVMALLEEFDRRGILTRTPQGHVRGPRT
jgi:selenocysteine-specific elongation factor